MAAQDPSQEMELAARILLIVIALLPVLGVAWFLYLFTGVAVAPGRIEQIILFCYLFTGIALVGSVLPFLAFPFAPSLQQLMIFSPIGVTPGCKAYPIDADTRSELKELACGNRTDQWVINIGGITQREVSRPTADATPGAAPSEGASHGPVAWPVVTIQGGLVVPLYVIVLSLMGAAVSMTRRVPEYQQRLIPGTVDTITKEQARQYLVFQVMQVISAPLIAIAAYHLVEPDTPKVSVLLGFISGFASEIILLHILAATRKLSGSSTLEPGANLAISIVFAPTSAGARSGTLTITDNAPGSPRTIALSGEGV
jgi:hypothetical protein